MDLTTENENGKKWNLSNSTAQKIEEKLREEAPWLALTLPCTRLGATQPLNFPRQSDKLIMDRMMEVMARVDFAV